MVQFQASKYQVKKTAWLTKRIEYRAIDPLAQHETPLPFSPKCHVVVEQNMVRTSSTGYFDLAERFPNYPDSFIVINSI